MLNKLPANDNGPVSDYLNGFINETMAANFLRQSVRTIQKWRVTGYGHAFYKSGRSVRYRRCELLEWTKQRRFANTSNYTAA